MWSKIWNLPLFRVLLWREYICDMEKDKCIILLKKKMTILKEKYGITSLVLFGSTARGEETEKSDIDLFVETQTANPFLLQDAKEFLEKEMGIPVDIVRDHENLNPKLRKRILKDGIAIFWRNRFCSPSRLGYIFPKYTCLMPSSWAICLAAYSVWRGVGGMSCIL